MTIENENDFEDWFCQTYPEAALTSKPDLRTTVECVNCGGRLYVDMEGDWVHWTHHHDDWRLCRSGTTYADPDLKCHCGHFKSTHHFEKDRLFECDVKMCKCEGYREQIRSDLYTQSKAAFAASNGYTIARIISVLKSKQLYHNGQLNREELSELIEQIMRMKS
jgi:hypothetical protein